MAQKKEISIIGAGLVGTLLSIYLAKRGYTVTIFERRGDMRKAKVEAGRSINLALSDRGIKALTEVGIIDEVMKIAIPMYGRHIHNLDGSEAFQPYGKEGQYINSVSRSGLNVQLMNLAEERGVKFYFEKKLDKIDWSNKEIAFEGEEKKHSFELLIGSDGAYASTRLAHMLSHSNFEYHQYYIDCGYKEISIPAGENGSYLIEKTALHIWPRGDYMLIALPNTDGSFTGTLFFPFEGKTSFASLQTSAEVKDFFATTFPDIVPIVPDLEQQFFTNPTASLVTVKCFPWIREDYFLLIGDASHAIVPFFGQGMNAGFEDCSVLNSLLDSQADNWKEVLPLFQQVRKPDADAIADLAVNNFTEMRSRTADPKFLLQKKIEARLHQKHPHRWIPAYSQVTFSPQIRYSEALRNSKMQEQIMAEIMSRPQIDKEWESEEIEKLILSKI